MSDGVVSIGEGGVKSTGIEQASPTHRRRGSNFTGLGITSVAPAPGARVKRSPQGSVTGGSSTKGSEKDDMEEVSNEEGESTRLVVFHLILNYSPGVYGLESSYGRGWGGI